MPYRRPLVILQVEDTLADAQLTERAMDLGDFHHSMHVVNDGASAIDFLMRRPPYQQVPRPDMILLDLDLPRLNGSKVLEFIKKEETLKTIPVIIFSTCESVETMKHAYELHANSYVVKPMDLEDFTRKVQSIGEYWCHTSEITAA